METTSHEKLLVQIASILERFDIEYLVTGGFAVSVWGRPRATFDIDIVIKLGEPKVALLAKALRKISEDGYIDEDTAKDAIHHEGEFNFIDSQSGLKVDFWIAKKKGHAILEFKRKKTEKINGQKVYFVSPEDLILSKLEWHQQSQSSRHLEDVESILKISGDKLDKAYLKQWAERLAVLEALDKLWQQ